MLEQYSTCGLTIVRYLTELLRAHVCIPADEAQRSTGLTGRMFDMLVPLVVIGDIHTKIFSGLFLGEDDFMNGVLKVYDVFLRCNTIERALAGVKQK